MMRLVLKIPRMHLIPLPSRSLTSDSETNVDGLAKGCRQPPKSDQVPDLSEKGYSTQKSQVLELNETHLVEGKRVTE